MNVYGIKFPLEVSSSRGDLSIVSNAELYRSHLIHWLRVAPIERVMRPEYGMKDLLFDQIPNTAEVTSYVTQELNKYIPEINVEVNTSVNDGGELLITVNWSYLEQEQSPLQVTL